MRCAVKPRYKPTYGGSRRVKKKVDPTSVNKPILASGMASLVLLVAILKGAIALSPRPPPIAIPFQNAIWKVLAYFRAQNIIRLLLIYFT